MTLPSTQALVPAEPATFEDRERPGPEKASLWSQTNAMPWFGRHTCNFVIITEITIMVIINALPVPSRWKCVHHTFYAALPLQIFISPSPSPHTNAWQSSYHCMRRSALT